MSACNEFILAHSKYLKFMPALIDGCNQVSHNGRTLQIDYIYKDNSAYFLPRLKNYFKL